MQTYIKRRIFLSSVTSLIVCAGVQGFAIVTDKSRGLQWKVLLAFKGDKIDKNEMGGTCRAYGGRGEAYTVFRWGNMRERDH